MPARRQLSSHGELFLEQCGIHAAGVTADHKMTG
jgi:hypothetical protein